MVRSLGRILGVWAHPDDETYLSAGLMADAVRNGSRVVCVTATRGEAGSQDEQRWPRTQMARIRELELKDSLDVLGVEEHHWLDYVDGTCDTVDADEAVAKLQPIFEDVGPDSVLTFGPDGLTGHPDHIAVSSWTSTAFDRFAKRGAKLFYPVVVRDWYEQFGPLLNEHNVYAPGSPPIMAREDLDLLYDLSDELADLKMRAIGAQVSQVEQLHAALGRDFVRDALMLESFKLHATHS